MKAYQVDNLLEFYLTSKTSPEIDLFFNSYLSKIKIKHFYQTAISANTSIRKILLCKVISLLDQISAYLVNLKAALILQENELNEILVNNSKLARSFPSNFLQNQLIYCKHAKKFLDTCLQEIGNFYQNIMRLVKNLHQNSYQFRIFCMWLEMKKIELSNGKFTGFIGGAGEFETGDRAENRAVFAENRGQNRNFQGRHAQGPDSNSSSHQNSSEDEDSDPRNPKSSVKNSITPYKMNLSDSEMDIVYEFLEKFLADNSQPKLLIKDEPNLQKFSLNFENLVNYKIDSRNVFPRFQAEEIEVNKLGIFSSFLDTLEDFDFRLNANEKNISLLQKSSQYEKVVYKHKKLRWILGGFLKAAIFYPYCVNISRKGLKTRP